jgi:hypothetical protein
MTDVRLVYLRNFRPAWATQREFPVSKTANEKQTKEIFKSFLHLKVGLN